MPDERKLSSGPCVEPEVLAAYVDGRLTPDERAAVDAHLAVCGDCYALLTEVIRTADDMDGRVLEIDAPVASSNVRHGVFGRRRIYAIGGLLAAAAAVVLAVRLQPNWFGGDRGDLSDGQLATLVNAIGEHRYTEARLTGGFRYGPLRPTTRSVEEEPNLSLMAAAGEIQKRAQAEQSPENLHALGVSYLLTGNVDLAIENLRKAAEAEENARFLSDLAAAYVTRATRSGRAEDLPQALSATERALRIDATLREAQFNKALILEELGLRNEARAAWQQYLQLDASSPWAEHARARVGALGTARRRLSTDEAATYLLADRSRTAELVSSDAQLARETVEDVLLPHWGELFLARDPLAEGVLSTAEETARALTAAGDGITERAVEAIRNASADARLNLAAGHRVWREGRAAFATVDPSRFAPLFERAATIFEANGSPLALWCRHYLAVALYLQGRINEGEAATLNLLRRSKSERSPSLTGRLRWDLGSMFYQQARFGEVLTEYSAALRLFSELREHDNTAAMHQSIAETLGRLGRMDESWRAHRSALQLVQSIRDPRRRQAVLTGAGYTALNASLPEAAFHFFSEARTGAQEIRDNNYLFEAEAGTGRALVLAEREQEAQSHLNAALTIEPSVGNASFRSRFGADVRLALAEIAERTGDAGSVIARTDEVLQRVTAVSSEYRLAHLHLMRGRAFRRLQRVGDSRAALEAGIAHLESKRALLQQETLRISYLDQAWDLYDELVALLALDLRDPGAALSWADRGRARVLRETLDEWDETRAALAIPKGAAVLFLTATDRGLFEWVLRSDHDLVFAHRDAKPRDIREIVRIAQSSRDAEDRRHALGRLRDLLLQPVETALTGIERLAIVPDSVTQEIPFASIPDAAGAPVVQKMSLLLTTNVAAATRSHADVAQPLESIAVFVASENAEWPNLPPLPGAESEARSIAALYPDAAIFRGPDANVTNLMRAAERYSVLHVAVHAVADTTTGNRVSLVLSDRLVPSTDSILAARSRTLRVALLVACSTLKGQRSRGEVLMNMARPFLLAGADYALVTLWDIDDDRAEELMTVFHRRLREGLPPDMALADAQRAAIARDPASTWWAGFALVAH